MFLKSIVKMLIYNKKNFEKINNKIEFKID